MPPSSCTSNDTGSWDVLSLPDSNGSSFEEIPSLDICVFPSSSTTESSSNAPNYQKRPAPTATKPKPNNRKKKQTGPGEAALEDYQGYESEEFCVQQHDFAATGPATCAKGVPGKGREDGAKGSRKGQVKGERERAETREKRRDQRRTVTTHKPAWMMEQEELIDYSYGSEARELRYKRWDMQTLHDTLADGFREATRRLNPRTRRREGKSHWTNWRGEPRGDSTHDLHSLGLQLTAIPFHESVCSLTAVEEGGLEERFITEWRAAGCPRLSTIFYGGAKEGVVAAQLGKGMDPCEKTETGAWCERDIDSALWQALPTKGALPNCAGVRHNFFKSYNSDGEEEDNVPKWTIFAVASWGGFTFPFLRLVFRRASQYDPAPDLKPGMESEEEIDVKECRRMGAIGGKKEVKRAITLQRKEDAKARRAERRGKKAGDNF